MVMKKRLETYLVYGTFSNASKSEDDTPSSTMGCSGDEPSSTSLLAPLGILNTSEKVSDWSCWCLCALNNLSSTLKSLRYQL